MSSILYYSNYCEKCKDLLRLIGKSDLKNDMHFVCIDKRFRDPQTGIEIRGHALMLYQTAQQYAESHEDVTTAQAFETNRGKSNEA